MRHGPRRDREATPRDEQRDGTADNLSQRFPWRSRPLRQRGPGPYGPPIPRPVHAPAGGSHDPPRGDADDNDAASSDDDLSPRSFTPGSQDGISESSDFSLILHGEDLDGAKAKFSSLYRAEVEALFPHAGRRSHSGKMSWMQRDIANSDWQRLREQAERYLSNERLANWGNWVTANAQGHRSAGQRRE